MVYKRYIIRGGKRFGPYYYRSYRDEKGIPQMEKVDKPVNTLLKLSYLLIGLGLIAVFLILFFGFKGTSNEKNIEVTGNVISASYVSNNFLISFNVIKDRVLKFIGKVIEGESAPQETPSEAPSETPQVTPIEEPTQETSSKETPTQEEITETPIEEIITEETPQEPSIETPIGEESNQTQETPSENASIQETTSNETNQNITIESQTNITSQNITLENATITNQTIGNISLNANETNITSQNITLENKTLGKTNFTTEISTIQHTIKLGEPVKWTKKVKLDIVGEGNISELTIELPSLAGNVSVKKKDLETNEENEVKNEVKNEKNIKEVESVVSITGNIVKSEKQIKLFNRIFRFFNSFFSLIGRVIDSLENSDDVLVNIQEELTEQDEIEIEYYTNAPYSEEIIFNEAHKKITIIGPDEIHYQEILAFSELPDEINFANEIKLYWLVNGSKELINFSTYDTNENSLYDYIEWLVPYLSNQTYEIILITNAIHLDSNKNFISDIYNEVKELDENWSEPINSEEYVRITFETNLTSSNDITIYPRIVNGTPKIEIYEIDKDEIIAEFESLNENEYNKIYLTVLNNTQDTFDLKVLNGAIEINHIIDPFDAGDGTSGSPYQISNCTSLQDVANNLTAYYVLTSNINCSDTINWNSGAGFVPIDNFEGDFNGSNYNITDLYIYRTSTNFVGLFGRVNTSFAIYDVGLVNANVTGNNAVGTIAGKNTKGNISNVFSTGNVNRVISVASINFGGLIGRNDGSISNSYSTANVNGNDQLDQVGGLVGYTTGNISNSYATGNVTGDWYLGGFVGNNAEGTISNSYSTGNVITNTGDGAGGFAGYNTGGNISNSYSTANVTGTTKIGGFIGNHVSGNISNSYSTGNANAEGNYAGGFAGYNTGGNISNSYSTGNANVIGNYIGAGGFVGYNDQGNISNSYSTGNATGTNYVGGFVGWNNKNILNSYSTGNATGTNPVGGFAGSNVGNISNSYSTGKISGTTNVGGFVGINTGGSYVADYWNNQTSGSTSYLDIGDDGDDSNIFANNTIEMVKQATFINWNFANIWKINETYSYPCLQWQANSTCVQPSLGRTNPIADFGTNPINVLNSTNTSQTFELKCSDDAEVDALELWGNWTGTWSANQTNSSPINNTYWNVTVSGIPDGTHLWGVKCNDTLNNIDWSDTNRSLIIDTTSPIIEFISPTPNNNVIVSNVTLNTTITDNLETSAWFDWNKTLIGYWSFEDSNSTGIFDNSTYNNFLKFKYGLSESNLTNGKRGNAITFDGVDDDLQKTNFNYSVSQGAVSFWMNLNAENNQTIFRNYEPATPYEDFIRSHINTDNTIDLRIENGDSELLGVSYNLSNLGTYTNNWIHVVWTQDGTGVKLYINGSQMSVSGTNNGNWASHLSTTTLEFGWGWGVNLNGSLDEIMFFKRALNSSEVLALYNNQANRLFSSFNSFSDGTYNYSAYAIDSAGNLNITSPDRKVTLDTTPPSITATCNPSSVTTGEAFPCSCSASDSGSGVSSISASSTSPDGTATPSNTGTFTYTCSATDNVGNSASSSVVYSVTGTGGETEKCNEANDWCLAREYPQWYPEEENFEINPESIIIILHQGEQKNQDINIKNLGYESLNLNLNLIGIKEFATLGDEVIFLGVGGSKTTKIIFSSNINSVPGLYNGKIEIAGQEITKTINITLQILEGREGLSYCGDGIASGTEKCDDGNRINGDGCSSACQIELSGECDNDNNKEDNNPNILGEFCDRDDLNGKACTDFGYTGGILSCNNDCSFNINGCTTFSQAYCGNKIIESGEQCDRSLNNKTCGFFGFDRGNLSCSSDCQFDVSLCKNDMEDSCGNKVIDSGEHCDGNLNNKTCSDFGFINGSLSCADCQFNTSLCLGSQTGFCGNSIINSGEQCDGSLNNKTCGFFGFDRGNLSCGLDCQFDTSLCINNFVFSGAYCGNKIINHGEQCDESLHNKNCTSFGFNYGKLSCVDCKYNTILCNNKVLTEKPEKERKFPIPITPITITFLFILLLIILLLYFAIKRYTAIRTHLAGYETREEKIAFEERVKKVMRQDNFFEKIIDKVAISLVGED